MNEHPFQRFINLVQFDQQIQLLETEISNINQEVASVEEYDKKINSELESAKTNLIRLKKQVDALELEMKSLDQQEKEKKVLAESISTYKEHQSIKIEIESIQKLQLKQEQAILDMWNRLESAQTLLERKEKETSALLEQHQIQLKEQEGKHARLVDQLNELIAQRDKKEQVVPEEWLEKYRAMRSRVSDPVVPIEYNSCSVCSQQITSQEIIHAKRGALLQCKNCFRLLFIPEIIHSVQ